MSNPFNYLDATVYPSTEKTISVLDDTVYGGAHIYFAYGCKGFDGEKTVYTPGEGYYIPFVKKEMQEDLENPGQFKEVIIPGFQSEQLVHILLDRHAKLNAVFPSAQYEKMKAGLEMFLEACKERVDERMNRGVMGKLEK